MLPGIPKYDSHLGNLATKKGNILMIIFWPREWKHVFLIFPLNLNLLYNHCGAEENSHHISPENKMLFWFVLHLLRSKNPTRFVFSCVAIYPRYRTILLSSQYKARFGTSMEYHPRDLPGRVMERMEHQIRTVFSSHNRRPSHTNTHTHNTP